MHLNVRIYHQFEVLGNFNWGSGTKTLCILGVKIFVYFYRELLMRILIVFKIENLSKADGI